jgi:hypothetical protein
MLKKHLQDDECYGLTAEEIQLAEKYLKKNKTAGALKDSEAFVLYEMFMIGTSFADMHLQYPQYPLPQIILTAALRKWPLDRERMMGSLKDRVRAKVVKSVVESVDFLTSMISVANAEHLEEMRKYVMDPKHNKKPELRIESIKEYKEILETLQKMVDGANNPKQKSSAMYGALEDTKKLGEKLPAARVEDDPSRMLADIVEVDDASDE